MLFLIKVFLLEPSIFLPEFIKLFSEISNLLEDYSIPFLTFLKSILLQLDSVLILLNG